MKSSRRKLEEQREKALDILEKHGFRSHYYLPAIGMTDPELAEACRFLSQRGHIITDQDGRLVGAFAATRLTPNEVAEEKRKSIRRIK